MGANATPETWTTFWQEFCPENEPHEACFVPADGRIVLDNQWANFANSLPQGAQVVDLGCGAGIVGSTLLHHRADLQVVGVDWACVTAISHAHLAIHTAVSMEALPFDDGSFDAAVSQFGIEYANIADTVRELERVLKANAPFCFLVHHRDSEIVREGSARRRALEELLTGQIRSDFLSGSAAGIEQQKRSLGSRYPRESMVKLVGNYFLRNVARTGSERQAIWQKLLDDLNPEILLLSELERSAKSAAELGPWLVPLLTGMRSVNACVARRKSGEPIAWHIRGER